MPVQRTVQAQCPPDCTPGHVVQMGGGGYLCNVRFPPEAVPGEIGVAQIYGYAAAPVDIFACGVAFFILHCATPPWPMACLNQKGFAYVYQHGVAALLRGWKRPMGQFPTELLAG